MNPDIPLSEEAAEAHVHGICFKTGPPGRVGVELEWLVCDSRDPALPVAPGRVTAALAGLAAPGSLPAAGRLTMEPGGQLELSSQPAATLADCVASTGRDLAAIRSALQPAGLRLVGHGLDPFRPPRRISNQPRYAAMEEFFDRRGPWGRVMMCSTASVQVCLDAGTADPGPGSYRTRWSLLHSIGPLLVAAFANSPLRNGRPTGWRSTRQAVWAAIDPGRTRAPAGARLSGSAPRSDWARYALDAEVMCIRGPRWRSWSAPVGLTFREWLRSGLQSSGLQSSGPQIQQINGAASPPSGPARGLRPPTCDDLDYHLSTLFPPVRPRGHLELRMIDAQPGDGWVVPTAVTAALLADPLAADAALAAAEPIWAAATGGDGNGAESPWLRAAREGPADKRFARAIRACFEAADAALGRSAANQAAIRPAVADFAERYVARGRCPADDRLDALNGSHRGRDVPPGDQVHQFHDANTEDSR